jgi:hypothetical protein
MKKIQTFTNANLELNKTAHIFQTMPQKGLSDDVLALYKPTYEVSTNSGGIDIAWTFQSFIELEDAQQYALQFIMPKGMLCKIVSS